MSDSPLPDDRWRGSHLGRLMGLALRRFDERVLSLMAHDANVPLALSHLAARAQVGAAHIHLTRHLGLQGSRLTAWELVNEEIPVTLNADSAAAHIMKTKGVTWVIVGADRITANGDVANKIGTYQLAVNAMHHGVRFMVVAPSSTIDMNLASGEDIALEERDAGELLEVGGKRIGEGVEAFNPVFDVTPADFGLKMRMSQEQTRGIDAGPDLHRNMTSSGCVESSASQ